MMRAEFALIDFAYKLKTDTQRFILVSDDTFPLLPPASLSRFFQDPVERIMLRKLDADDPFMERYTKFFFLDHRATALHGRAAERSDMDAELFAEMEGCRLLMAKGKVAQNIYYGSQWWALTRETCEHLLNVIRDDNHFVPVVQIYGHS